VNLHPDPEFPEPDDEDCDCDACKSGLCDAVESGEIDNLEFAKTIFKSLNTDILNWLMSLSYLVVHSHGTTGSPIRLTIAGTSLAVTYLGSADEPQVTASDKTEGQTIPGIAPLGEGWSPVPESHKWLN